MADNSDPAASGPGIKIATASSEQAPFIYFDGVPCFGVNNGAIQIELAANALMPEGQGVRIDILICAHLRCSPTAAAGLRDSLDKALAMLQKGQDQVAEPAPVGKPN